MLKTKITIEMIGEFDGSDKDVEQQFQRVFNMHFPEVSVVSFEIQNPPSKGFFLPKDFVLNHGEFFEGYFREYIFTVICETTSEDTYFELNRLWKRIDELSANGQDIDEKEFSIRHDELNDFIRKVWPNQ